MVAGFGTSVAATGGGGTWVVVTITPSFAWSAGRLAVVAVPSVDIGGAIVIEKVSVGVADPTLGNGSGSTSGGALVGSADSTLGNGSGSTAGVVLVGAAPELSIISVVGADDEHRGRPKPSPSTQLSGGRLQQSWASTIEMMKKNVNFPNIVEAVSELEQEAVLSNVAVATDCQL